MDIFFDFSRENICAAYIQGVFNFVAGTFVLIAGHLAYVAATREIRRHEEQQKARRLSYCVHMKGMVQSVTSEMDKLSERTGSIILEEFNAILTTFSIEKWEDNALLGEELVADISRLYSNTIRLKNLSTVSKDSSETRTMSRNGLLKASESLKNIVEKLDTLHQSLRSQ